MNSLLKEKERVVIPGESPCIVKDNMKLKIKVIKYNNIM